MPTIIADDGGGHRVVVVVQESTVTTARADTAVVEVGAVGVQGPKGPAGNDGAQGIPGPAGAANITKVLTQALGGHRLVRSAGGAIGYVDPGDPTHGDDTLGITASAGAAGDTVAIVTFGPIDFNGWAWTPDEPVFAAANGGLTQTPDSSAAFLQIIGHAQSPTTLFVSIAQPIYS